MTEHPEMSCAELAEVAAELALGVLTGRERAEAVAHLDRCESCREHVRQLMVTSEGLIGLLPDREPPAGFETRVLDRLGLSAPGVPSTARGVVPSPRRPSLSRWTRAESFPRRTLAAAAVALAVVIAGLGGWGVGVSMPPRPAASQAQAPLASAVFLTASHQSVGQLFIYQDSPRWLYMSVDLPSGDDVVTCQVIGSDGKVSVLGKFRLTSGYGAWGSPAPGNLGGVRGARLVAADGKTLASATFN